MSLRARPLRPGDRIAVVAPSSPVDLDPLDRGLAALRGWGYDVVEGRHLRTATGHLAGTDEQRAADLDAAFRDPTVRAVIAGRGGYGVQRLVDRLDWEALRHDPKVLVGFSDITALLLAAWNRLRLVTIHGPVVTQLGRVPDGAAARRLRAMLAGEDPPAPLTFSASQVMVPGAASGPLVGGNLAVLAAGVGAVDMVDARGAILVLEDVNEAPYAIDRMLTTLLRAGALEGVAGVVLGGFHRCAPPSGRPSATVTEVVQDRLGGLGVPLVHALPLGHGVPPLAVPLGADARLVTAAGCLMVGSAVAGPD